MRTNALRLTRRHTVEASRTLSFADCAPVRRLSSVAAVRSDDNDDQGTSTMTSTSTRMNSRFPPTMINGTIRENRPKMVKTESSAKQPDKTLAEMSGSEEIQEVPDQQKQQNEMHEVNENYLHQIHSGEEPHISPTHLTYLNGQTMPLTSKLHIVEPGEDAPRGIWPVYRIMDEDGCFRCPSNDGYIDPNGTEPSSNNEVDVKTTTTTASPEKDHDLDALRAFLSEKYPFHATEISECSLLQSAAHPFADTSTNNTLLRAQRQMIRLRQMDNILQNAQRQGRISFYMTCRGEEAIHIGSASALKPQDVILAQYREHGLLMWRGFTLNQFTNQCFSNDLDLGRGRQMPIHYGSKALNYHTISSPLGTQIPQATGVAYKMKLDAVHDTENAAIAICYFGDGCASTTDFHAGLNFAATLKTPTIFFCRNNGFAISTSIEDQYAGDGIVSRATGYGMAGLRVDGNDIFAVNAAVRKAREYCLENNAPILIEAITYRQGHHSTSDDSSRYRSPTEVHTHLTSTDPVKRFNKFLDSQCGWMSPEDTAKVRDEERMAVLKAMEAAERRPPPSLDLLFTDVYAEMPTHLQRQGRQLQEHLSKYPGKY